MAKPDNKLDAETRRKLLEDLSTIRKRSYLLHATSLVLFYNVKNDGENLNPQHITRKVSTMKSLADDITKACASLERLDDATRQHA